jgi:hypothetical protein
MQVTEIAAILTQVSQQSKMLVDLIEHAQKSPAGDSYLVNHKSSPSISKRCIEAFP